jgi:ribosome-binding factor A
VIPPIVGIIGVDVMPREFSRQQRLGAQIQRSLSELLRFETKDPALSEVSLTSVDLSKDLGVARVYFSMLHPDDDVAPAQRGLERAAGFRRAKLVMVIKIRYVPQLRFVHDDSIAHGAEISRLIDRATATGTEGPVENDDD